MKYTIAIVRNCDNKKFEICEKKEIGEKALGILTDADLDNEKLGFLVKTILKSGYGVAISEE